MKEFFMDKPSDFQVEKNKDLEHDVYTIECENCKKEFSVFVPHVTPNKERTITKETQEQLAKILAHKKCPNCRK